MNCDHSKLVKDARDQAMTIDTTIISGGLDGHLELMEAISPTLRTLANVVEKQDKSEAQLVYEVKLHVINAQDKSIAELAAACVTCDEVIGAFIREYPAREALDDWARLRAARKLAQVAVENWKKSQVEETVKEADETANDSPRLEMVDRGRLDVSLKSIENRINSIEKRLAGIEQGHDDLNVANVNVRKRLDKIEVKYHNFRTCYETHMKNCHTGDRTRERLTEIERVGKLIHDRLAEIERKAKLTDEQIDVLVEDLRERIGVPTPPLNTPNTDKPPEAMLHGGRILSDPPPADWDRYHELLDKLPELTPTEQVEYNRFLPIIERLDAEEGKAAGAALDNLVEEHERVIASVQRLTGAVNAAAEQHGSPPPPIKVEMLIVPPPWKTAGWTWVTMLADLHLYGSQGWPCEYFESRQDMAKNGNAWLAALSKQLGVELVAVWPEDETKGGE